MSTSPSPFDPAAETSIVYRSDSLLARRVGGYSNRACVITFAPFEDHLHPERQGFGEIFFQQVRIDAIHIVPAGNHWYQYPDLPEMCAKIREITAGYDRVVAYGSSMGAYAAIRYGGWAGADLALAISPQFRVAFGRPPFERRWFRYVLGLRFPHESGADAVPEALIVYDPLTKDRDHARLFQSITRATLVPIAYSGHPSGVTLMQAGLLAPMLVQLCDGTFDLAQFREATQALCQDTPQYHIERATRTRGARRRYQLALQARDASPGNPSTLRLLSKMAYQVREYDVAIAASQTLMEIEPNFAVNRYLHGRAHARAGRLDLAIDLLEPLLGAEGHRPAFTRELWRVKLQRAWRRLLRLDRRRKRQHGA